MSYKPNPIDTKNVEVPQDLLLLGEQLANNVHEVWAEQRIQQGWQYGPERNDQHKLHPNIVPYENLVEIDKDYDRNTVMETIKVILKLGYDIKKVEHN